MAYYSDMKARIISEMIRDDLADGEEFEAQLALHVHQACEFYAARKFWFNSVVTTATTTADVQDMDIPAGVRVVERVTIPSIYTTVQEVQLGMIEEIEVSGAPQYYAYYNNALRFWPIPDQAYTVKIYGIAQIDAPALAADTSVWTNEAQDLIVGRVKKNLCRAQFRDADGAALAASEEQEAYDRLLRETSRRLETPMRPRAPGRRYNINTDT